MQATRTGVVGGGLMGVGIALKAALAGSLTRVIEPDAQRAARIAEVADGILGELVEAGAIASDAKAGAIGRLTVSHELHGLADCDWVIEAIPEDLAAKRQLLAQVEDIVSPAAVLASNTSGFLPDTLCEAMQHPQRFLVTHFWNPPHVIALVEVVPGSRTDAGVVQRTAQWLSAMRAQPVVLKSAIPGFIGNRLQFALLREALHIVRSGAASAETVDAVMKASLGRRYGARGPFECADIGGLGTFLSIATHLMPTLAKDEGVLELLREQTRAGRLGLSTGKGFYDWDSGRIGKLQAIRRAQLVNIH